METKTNKINLKTTSIMMLLLASIAVSAFAIPSHALAQSHKSISNLKIKSNSNLNSHGNNQKTCVNNGKDKETKEDVKGSSNKETKEDGICDMVKSKLIK